MKTVFDACLESIKERGANVSNEPKFKQRYARLNFHQQEIIDRRLQQARANGHNAGTKSATPNHHGLVIVRACDVQLKRVDFIWHGRLARGEHTLIAGAPGLGKSQLTIAIVAAVSTGGPWPCGEGRAPLGNIVMLCAEDNVEHTVVPRLKAAGADLERVTIVTATTDDDGKGNKASRSFNLQADLVRLRSLIDEIGNVALIIIDPVTSYMGKLDGRQNTQVRDVLQPVGQLPHDASVAICSVTHFSKSAPSASTKALYKVIDSIAFVAQPRAIFTVMTDTDDHDRCLFLHLKNNLSRPPQGLAFRLEQHIVGSDKEGDIIGSHIVWEAKPVDTTADEILQADAGAAKGGSALREAKDFLLEYLADGPKPQKQIEAAAKDAGITPATLRRARKALDIKPQKHGLREGWTWSLAEDAQHEPQHKT